MLSDLITHCTSAPQHSRTVSSTPVTQYSDYAVNKSTCLAVLVSPRTAACLNSYSCLAHLMYLGLTSIAPAGAGVRGGAEAVPGHSAHHHDQRQHRREQHPPRPQGAPPHSILRGLKVPLHLCPSTCLVPLHLSGAPPPVWRLRGGWGNTGPESRISCVSWLWDGVLALGFGMSECQWPISDPLAGWLAGHI